MPKFSSGVISGLLGGISEGMETQKERSRQEEIRKQEGKLKILDAALRSSPEDDPGFVGTILDEAMETLTGGAKGKQSDQMRQFLKLAATPALAIGRVFDRKQKEQEEPGEEPSEFKPETWEMPSRKPAAAVPSKPSFKGALKARSERYRERIAGEKAVDVKEAREKYIFEQDIAHKNRMDEIKATGQNAFQKANTALLAKQPALDMKAATIHQRYPWLYTVPELSYTPDSEGNATVNIRYVDVPIKDNETVENRHQQALAMAQGENDATNENILKHYQDLVSLDIEEKKARLTSQKALASFRVFRDKNAPVVLQLQIDGLELRGQHVDLRRRGLEQAESKEGRIESQQAVVNARAWLARFDKFIYDALKVAGIKEDSEEWMKTREELKESAFKKNPVERDLYEDNLSIIADFGRKKSAVPSSPPTKKLSKEEAEAERFFKNKVIR